MSPRAPLEECRLERLWEKAEVRGMSRRRFLALLTTGGAAAVLAGCPPSEDTTTSGPATTAGETTVPEAAEAPGIVKPLPERFFIRQGSTNAETRFEALAEQDYLTPNSLFFVRSHESTPIIDPGEWRLRVGGDGVEQPFELTYDELLALPSVKVTRYLECAGNGRSFFASLLGREAQGSQWKFGAFGIAEWTGVPFREILERARLRSNAVDVMPTGLDAPKIERPMSVEKAMRDDTILAYAMNGDLLPPDHGFPVRALVPGWVGINSVKWVGSITVSTERLFVDKNTNSYVLIGPGYQPEDEAKGPIITEQVLKSAVCLPFPATLPPGGREIVGYAWSPHGRISRVEVSLNGGRTFQPATLVGPNLPLAGTRWTFTLDLQEGDLAITPRATDERGNTQPPVSEQRWNELGYLFGAMVPHPVAVRATTTTSAAATTTISAATTTTSAATTEGVTGTQAAGELAAPGRRLYEESCARCHGAGGQGGSAPALIASGANLGRFGDGARLFDYVKRNMPADSPGSLSDQQTLQVTAHLLLQNQAVEEGTPLSVTNLSEIGLRG